MASLTFDLSDLPSAGPLEGMVRQEIRGGKYNAFLSLQTTSDVIPIH